MTIADNIIKSRLQNVYFLWGRGKTTIAAELRRRYGCAVYDVDAARDRHAANADAIHQPAMCRDYMREYGVTDFWKLPSSVIREREILWLREFTPMAVADLLVLAARHDIVVCEGDLDYEAIIPIASHMVYLLNQGTKFDWFNRPDHAGMLDSVKNRTDIGDAEKESIIANAYEAVTAGEGLLPDWAAQHNIKSITWNDETTIARTASEVAQCFGLSPVGEGER